MSHQGHPSSPQPHSSAAPAGPWSGPWGQLQTAANSWWRHQGIHGLAAGFAFPNNQGMQQNLLLQSEVAAPYSAWSPSSSFSSSPQTQPGPTYDTKNATL